MSSLIQNYEYDIFISYRHKDNKYDGWVTGLVITIKHLNGWTVRTYNAIKD